jgi:putative intracellular protease/amidase
MPSAWLATNTSPLDSLQPDDADAWFILGGHGVLLDLVGHLSLQHLLTQVVGSDNGLVGALDHGVATLSRLTDSDGRPMLAGRTVTGRTDIEERDIRHQRLIPHSTEQLVRAAGARFSSTDPWKAHVVVDGRLVTGQNPSSATPAVDAVLSLAASTVPVAA